MAGRNLATATPLPVLPNRIPGLVLWTDASKGTITTLADPYCLSFNGTTAYVQTANNAGLTISTPFTLSIWAYSTGNTGALMNTAIENAPFDGIWFMWGGGSGRTNKPIFAINGTVSGVEDINASVALSQSTWYHLAATYDGSQTVAGMKIYVNGVAVATTTNTNTGFGAFTNRPFRLGTDTHTVPVDYFTGRLDDARIYNRVLTANEIASLATGNSITGTSLTSWWKLDEGTGITTADSSGNSNTGTLSGSTLPTWITTTPWTTTNVIQWNDQSGASNNASMATLAKQPILLSNSAANFVSASSQSLSVVSNSALQTGNVDFFVAAWVKASSVTDFAGIVTKDAFASTGEYFLQFGGTGGSTTGKFVFGVKSNSSTIVGNVNTVSTYLDGNWHFVIAVQDVANNRVGISVDGGAFVYNARTGTPIASTVAVTIGGYNAAATFLNGVVDAVVYGKPPTAIAALSTTITTALYNSGNGLAAKDITAAQRTAWGVISGWDFDGVLTSDNIGSNNLSNNNGVTLVAGKVVTTPTVIFNGSNSELDLNGINLSTTHTAFLTVNPVTLSGNFASGLGKTANPYCLGFVRTSSQYVDLGSAFAPPAALTWSAWIKVASIVDGDSQEILASCSAGAFNEFTAFSISAASGVIRIGFEVADTTASRYVQWRANTPSPVVTTGTWFHVAVTQATASSTPNIYVNGLNQTISVITNTGSPVRTSNPWAIGRITSISSNYFNGSIDDVRNYARVLSNNEIAILAAFGNPDATNLNNWWKLNEGTGTSTADSAGSQTGTLTNGPRWSSDTPASQNNILMAINSTNLGYYVPGNSASYDGSNQQLVKSSGATLPSAAQTWSGWALNNAASTRQFIFATSGGHGLLQISASNTFQACVNGTVTFITSSTTVSTGVWYHLTVVYDGVNISLYVNGTLEAGPTATTATIGSDTSFALGSSVLNAFNLTGQIDSFAFWSRVLSGAEITTLYNGGVGLAVSSYAGSLLTNLVSGFDFDTSLTTDFTGTNTLTNTGAVTSTSGKVPAAQAVVAHGVTANSFHVFAVRRNGTTVSFYKDGLVLGTNQTLGNNIALNISALGSYNGGGSNANMNLTEMMVYNTSLSDANVSTVFNYLKRYNLY